MSLSKFMIDQSSTWFDSQPSMTTHFVRQAQKTVVNMCVAMRVFNLQDQNTHLEMFA